MAATTVDDHLRNSLLYIAFGLRCKEASVRPSMGSVGDAYDNAMSESFFATLEPLTAVLAHVVGALPFQLTILGVPLKRSVWLSVLVDSLLTQLTVPVVLLPQSVPLPILVGALFL